MHIGAYLFYCEQIHKSTYNYWTKILNFVKGFFPAELRKVSRSHAEIRKGINTFAKLSDKLCGTLREKIDSL